MRWTTLLSWAFVGIWIEPSLPNTPMLLVPPENYFGAVNLEEMVKIWAISAHFDDFWSSCCGKHCSVGLWWGYRLESSPSNTLRIFALPMRYSCISVITLWRFENRHNNLSYNIALVIHSKVTNYLSMHIYAHAKQIIRLDRRFYRRSIICKYITYISRIFSVLKFSI